jgi:dTDP-4-amino-4,6-dideoxygalactose transaminase
VPAFSFPATANVVEFVGARPVFVDSEPGGFNIDVTKIENSITPATRAIVVVHNFGWPSRMDRVMEIAAKYKLPVFEDAACALGATYRGIRCGAIGDLAAFSFHPRKILTTGEGGAITTNDPDIATRALELRNHGQNPAATGEFKSVGLNYRMTDFQAALGLSQLRRYPSTLFRRKRAARRYDEHICRTSAIKPATDEHSRLNYQSYVVFAKENRRDKLIAQLKKEGIGAGIGTYSIPHTEYYAKKYGFTANDFKNSFHAWRTLMSLPLFDGITTEEQGRVIAAFARSKTSGAPRPKLEAVRA